MSVYKVADLVLDMCPRYCQLKDRAEPFLGDFGTVDISIPLEDGVIAAMAQRTGLDLPMAEYQYSCVEFCSSLLPFGGFVLHASAVLYKGGVFLFSAPSGVGKSTQASLWVQSLEDAVIINDDKPAIRVIDGVPYAYGTPWCGSGYIHANAMGPVKALYFIRRCGENRVKPMPADKVPYLIFESTMRPDGDGDMDALFKTLDAFVKNVPVFSLDCNMERDAVTTALSGLECV